MTVEGNATYDPDQILRSNPTIRSRWIMLNGVRTHYWEDGLNGPPVVMVHSGTPGSSGLSWFGNLLPELAPSHRPIALDSVGGYGWTDNSFPADKGMLSRLEHLEAFVDALCLERFVLIGASQGAWVASKYALRHPERVERLVVSASRALCCAVGLDAVDPVSVFDGSFESMRKVLQNAVYRIDDVTDDLVAHCLHVANRPGMEQTRVTYVRGNRRLMQDSELRREYDLRDSLPRLDVPTVCYWGRDDISAEPRWGVALGELLPRIKVRFLDNARHQIFRDRAALIADEIRAL